MMPFTLMRLIARILIVTLLFPLLSAPVLAGDGTCTKKSRVCIEGPETRMISGYPVTRACWKFENTYDCIAQGYVDDCKPLVDKGCAPIGSSCIDYVNGDPSGKCSLYEQTYQCKVADGATKTIKDCGGQTYCVDGSCFDAGYTPDGDFAIAITGMEALRQAGNYMDPSTLTLFNGSASKCRVTLGIFSCCKTNTKGSNQTNSSMMTSMGASLVKSVGSESIQYLGSTYMYDSLFQSDAPNFLINGFESVLGTGSSSTFSPSLSYFGLTVGIGAPAAGTTVLLGSAEAVAASSAAAAAATATAASAAATAAATAAVGTAAAASTAAAAAAATAAADAAASAAAAAAGTASASGTAFLAFDPTSFAIAIAIYIITELVSCDQDEQVLGMKRGQNLCVHVGTYCSSKVLGVCVQKKQGHCCFNSRIARLIASSGRAQLGKSWGAPATPDCGGLTPAELQKVDFSLIDFSEVVADVVASVKVPDYAIDRAKTKIESYYTTP
jgi:conjugal transfer mating pair stabilization protein TraN